jgi:DNA-binding transcriptional regulator YiaG
MPALAQQVREARLPEPALRRLIRKAAAVSLAEVAGELGVTSVTVLRWERGDSDPRRDRLNCRASNVTAWPSCCAAACPRPALAGA